MVSNWILQYDTGDSTLYRRLTSLWDIRGDFFQDWDRYIYFQKRRNPDSLIADVILQDGQFLSIYPKRSILEALPESRESKAKTHFVDVITTVLNQLGDPVPPSLATDVVISVFEKKSG